jgi:hypothetical protein
LEIIMNPNYRKNNVAYYRQHPAKLESLERWTNFGYGAMFGAGFFGFMAGIIMHVVATVVAVDPATPAFHGLLHVPVSLGMLLVAFVCLVLLQGAWANVATMGYISLIRDMLEEQGVVGAERPNVVAPRFAGMAVGALVGVFVSAFFLFAL